MNLQVWSPTTQCRSKRHPFGRNMKHFMLASCSFILPKALGCLQFSHRPPDLDTHHQIHPFRGLLSFLYDSQGRRLVEFLRFSYSLSRGCAGTRMGRQSVRPLLAGSCREMVRHQILSVHWCWCREWVTSSGTTTNMTLSSFVRTLTSRLRMPLVLMGCPLWALSRIEFRMHAWLYFHDSDVKLIHLHPFLSSFRWTSATRSQCVEPHRSVRWLHAFRNTPDCYVFNINFRSLSLSKVIAWRLQHTYMKQNVTHVWCGGPAGHLCALEWHQVQFGIYLLA